MTSSTFKAVELNAKEVVPFDWSKFIKLCLIGIVFLAVFWTVSMKSGYRIALNKSESLDSVAFVVTPMQGIPDKGSLVYFEVPANEYYKGLAIKEVVGHPGSIIKVIDGEVYVDGDLVGVAKKTTRTGIPLTAVSRVVVPENHLFLVGAHKDSFDSRYDDFGFVPYRNVQGMARAIF